MVPATWGLWRSADCWTQHSFSSNGLGSAQTRSFLPPATELGRFDRSQAGPVPQKLECSRALVSCLLLLFLSGLADCSLGNTV